MARRHCQNFTRSYSSSRKKSVSFVRNPVVITGVLRASATMAFFHLWPFSLQGLPPICIDACHTDTHRVDSPHAAPQRHHIRPIRSESSRGSVASLSLEPDPKDGLLQAGT